MRGQAGRRAARNASKAEVPALGMALMPKAVSSVIESFQAKTFRLNRSITAAGSMKPRAIGICVMSIAQTRLARTIGGFPSRYGKILCPQDHGT